MKNDKLNTVPTLMDRKLTWFSTLAAKKPQRFVSLGDIIQKIREGTGIRDKIAEIRKKTKEGKKDEAGKIKRKLPAIVFSGELTGRLAETLVNPSGLVVVDIDGIEDESALNNLKTRLKGDRHTVLLFVSPSGNGLKWVISAEFQSLEAHKQLMDNIFDYVESNYQVGEKMDRKCRDFARLTFLSYDPEIYLNSNPIEFKNSPKVNIDGREHTDDRASRANRENIDIDFKDKINEGMMLPFLPAKKKDSDLKLFTLARTLLSIDPTRSMASQMAAFELWWRLTNKEFLSQSKEEYEAEFIHKCEKAINSPDQNPIKMAMDRVEKGEPLPSEIQSFGTTASLKKMLALMYHLHQICGETFYLACQQPLAEFVGISKIGCWKNLASLEKKGWIEIVEIGRFNGNKATRYRWIGWDGTKNPRENVPKPKLAVPGAIVAPPEVSSDVFTPAKVPPSEESEGFEFLFEETESEREEF